MYYMYLWHWYHYTAVTIKIFVIRRFQGARNIRLSNPPAGSPHFGDIMGGAEGNGVVLLHHFEPLERVVLTANGNLQRIIR